MPEAGLGGLLAPIGNIRPGPADTPALRERVRLTVVALGYALSMAPALVLAILSVVTIALGPLTVGLVFALAVVPATAGVTAGHRWVTGGLLGQRLTATYADTSETTFLARPLRWLRDPARWRDFAFLWFSATGGFVLAVIPPGLLAAPITYLVWMIVDPRWLWFVLLLLSGPAVYVWWLVTPALVRARAVAERAILGGSRVAELQRRVERVTSSRSSALDHSAAEIRRIERDLHDGAQARIAAVGMSVGLAEKLVEQDPAAAVELLREARATTVSALEDLRAVVRGIHPPVLADRGLVGAVEALALTLPLPVTVSLVLDRRLPDPVESAAYFAIAECLANTIKHADATFARVSGSHDGELLRLVVGDDGKGGADIGGAGLTGVARRLAAFDGTLDVVSPAGGPTTATMEIPCRT
ncbi:Signal transduction histidine kinase [Parafrankia irregularis]|uniref:histidine kinase n=1 Tax=Parafrankia irregularis TaxID=795642 RepID=A0A0S4QYK6_9ACTN|nr:MULTISPECIES: histidine kinase [Parafrankia]MBE3204890.1 sensor domain-containing protein [Parafrankia sp. CH37]CUU60661.1 Signal transduction histidine kinase [Parafrankia irregularis]